MSVCCQKDEKSSGWWGITLGIKQRYRFFKINDQFHFEIVYLTLSFSSNAGNKIILVDKNTDVLFTFIAVWNPQILIYYNRHIPLITRTNNPFMHVFIKSLTAKATYCKNHPWNWRLLTKIPFGTVTYNMNHFLMYLIFLEDCKMHCCKLCPFVLQINVCRHRERCFRGKSFMLCIFQRIFL